MTQRGLPPIDPSDLRDHATPERIDRVWRRIAADISHGPAYTRPRRARYLVTALAAALAAFAVGLIVGKIASQHPNEAIVAVSSPDVAKPSDADDVLATGTRERHFTLPGGGSITLSPGSTVEVMERSGGALRLRLIQGEASVDTAGAPPSQLFDIVAEDTVLSTRTGGALRVSRSGDEVDVSVSNGQVDLQSPSGSQSLRTGDRAQALAIRRRPVAVHAPAPRPRGSSARDFVEAAPRVEPPAPVAAARADWRAKSSSGDFAEAYRLLKAQPGGVDGAIASATSAAELVELHDVVIGSDSAAAMRALTRIVESFPNDAYAQQYAAYKLGRMYERLGQREQARIYFDRVEGVLAEDAACQRIRAASSKEEGLRAAQEYLSRFPSGRCRDEAERVAAGETGTDDDPPPPPAESPAPAADAGAP